jgi:hypothetical protein
MEILVDLRAINAGWDNNGPRWEKAWLVNRNPCSSSQAETRATKM